MSSTADFQVLLQFENARKDNENCLNEFINNEPQLNANSRLQLELIALDIEIRLKLGDCVVPDQYLLEYPHLGNRVLEVHEEVEKDFLRSFCPIRKDEKQFPCEFGEFTVHAELGRGGMGVIYQATHRDTHQEVALKVLFLRRSSIQSEADVLSQMDHPNICKVYENGKNGQLDFMSFELVEGVNLKHHLKKVGRIEPSESVAIASQIASSLGHAHDKNIIHFDVKTSNVLLDSVGQIKMLDFGLATEIEKFIEMDAQNEKTFGSPAYMAPEFFNRDFGRPGMGSDIYGLGVVLYELLTGTVPFRGMPKDLADQICNHPPSRPTDFADSAVDDELEAICLRAMSKNVSERFKDMNEFKAVLDEWLEQARIRQRLAS